MWLRYGDDGLPHVSVLLTYYGRANYQLKDITALKEGK